MSILQRRLDEVETHQHELLQSKKTEHSRKLIKRNHTIIKNLKAWIKEALLKEIILLEDKTKAYFGIWEGDVCAREGCVGIIGENDKSESSCYCHQDYPCGHCTTPKTFCSSCDYKIY